MAVALTAKSCGSHNVIGTFYNMAIILTANCCKRQFDYTSCDSHNEIAFSTINMTDSAAKFVFIFTASVVIFTSCLYIPQLCLLQIDNIGQL